MITEHPDPTLPKYLIALAVNLAANKRNAQLMCENDGLRRLVERAFQYQDCLVLKMIRNISQHDGPTKILFVVSFVLFIFAICLWNIFVTQSTISYCRFHFDIFKIKLFSWVCISQYYCCSTKVEAYCFCSFQLVYFNLSSNRGWNWEIGCGNWALGEVELINMIRNVFICIW